MSTSRTDTQSPADRRSAEAEVRELVARLSPAHERLIGTARRALKKRLPTAHELVYEYRDCFVISYSPDDRGYEGVLALRAGGDGVQLYFNRGKGLPDPEKLLRGSGNQTRWVLLESASTLRRPAVERLMEQALARNRVPYARTGRGLLIIRSTSSRKTRGQPA